MLSCYRLWVYKQIKTITRHVFLLVVARTIYCPVYVVFVLLCFRLRTIYWLFSAKEILDLITLVLTNKVFFNFVLVYIILPSHKNPAYTTLNTVSIFSSLRSIGLYIVLFLRIGFVIGRRIVFCLRNNLLPFLMIKAMWSVSKAFRLKCWPMCYDFNTKR